MLILNVQFINALSSYVEGGETRRNSEDQNEFWHPRAIKEKAAADALAEAYPEYVTLVARTRTSTEKDLTGGDSYVQREACVRLRPRVSERRCV